MTDPVAKRPPTLVGACVYLGALSAIVSIRAINMVTGWNGSDRAADVAPALRALRDAGLSQADAESGYKIFLTVLAVLAACGVVFAVYTARGQHVSRIGLTVVVGLSGTATFLGAMGSDFLLAMIGALAVVFSVRLWTGEIRTYFRTLAGHPAPPPKEPRAPRPSKSLAAGDPFAQQPVQPSVAASQQPPAVQQPVAPQPPGYGPPPHGYYQQQPWQPAREPFPKPVSVAVWTAFTGSIVAAGLSALMLLLIVLGGLDYDTLVDQGGPGADMIRGSQNDFDTALRFITVLSSVSLVIGLAGLLASIRALVKRRSGEVPLFVMTVVGLVVSFIGFPLGIPWSVAAIVCLVQLRKPESRAWFSRT
jgi:hypothetical protein